LPAPSPAQEINLLLNKNNVHWFSSKSEDWATPQDVFDKLNAEFSFTLDPCATIENNKCDKFYTIAEDGLLQDWAGERVFMNPPYGRKIRVWVRKAYRSSLDGAVVVCLIPARTDTAYWHDYIFPFAKDIRYIRGRLNFGGCKSNAPFPSAIVVFGEK